MASTINLGTFRKGKTFKGRAFKVTSKSTGLPIDLTGKTLEMWVRANNKNGAILKKATIGTGLTIVDAAAGRAQIDAFMVTFEPGTVYYDVELGDGTTYQIVGEGYSNVDPVVTQPNRS